MEGGGVSLASRTLPAGQRPNGGIKKVWVNTLQKRWLFYMQSACQLLHFNTIKEL